MPDADELEARSRDYYDRMADGYDAMLETAANQATRACFWRQAETALPAGSHILDFGAGSGIDAAHFAGLGHRVTAYDQSEGMLRELRRRCAREVADGTVVPVGGRLDEARPTLLGAAPFDGIVSNFAVFSTIADLAPVFELFGKAVRPGGTVLIVIQNPWHPGDMRRHEFWHALLRMPLTQVMRYRSGELAEVFHYTTGQIQRAARANFFPGAPPAPDCARLHFGRASVFRLVTLQRR